MLHRSYLLELTSPDAFRPKPFPRDDIALARMTAADGEQARSLWTEVGRGFWTERSDWPPAQWHLYLGRPDVHFSIASIGAEPAGFFELTLAGDQVKLEGFGLLPAWRDRGLGGGLLSTATQRAFDLGARRIWLHTATDDHPHALSNYLARGYRIYHEEELRHPMTPDRASN